MHPVESTYRVLGYNTVSAFRMDYAVDWAYEMLLEGYETPNLLMLAAISKPTGWYEAKQYLQEALRELKFNELSGDEAYISYGCYYIKKIADGFDVRENLHVLTDEIQFTNLIDLFPDFQNLRDTYFDFDRGEMFSYYSEATPENIEDVAIHAAKKWLSKNEELLTRVQRQIGG